MFSNFFQTVSGIFKTTYSPLLDCKNCRIITKNGIFKGSLYVSFNKELTFFYDKKLYSECDSLDFEFTDIHFNISSITKYDLYADSKHLDSHDEQNSLSIDSLIESFISNANISQPMNKQDLLNCNNEVLNELYSYFNAFLRIKIEFNESRFGIYVANRHSNLNIIEKSSYFSEKFNNQTDYYICFILMYNDLAILINLLNAELVKKEVNNTNNPDLVIQSNDDIIIEENKKQIVSAINSIESIMPDNIFKNESDILSDEQIKLFSKNMPVRYFENTLEIIYSTKLHGYSLKTLYRNTSKYIRDVEVRKLPFVLILMDSHHNIFGALLDHPPTVTNTYLGTGECFLFKFSNSFSNDSANTLDCIPEFVKYKWKENDCFILHCALDYMEIGTSDGKSAIWFDESLTKGRSQYSLVFDSPCLSNQEDFDLIMLELFVFT